MTDGGKFTGRLRMYVMMRDMSPSDDAETFHVPVPALGYENEPGQPQGVSVPRNIPGGGMGVEEEKDATAKRGAQSDRKEIYKMFGNAMGLGNDMGQPPVHPRHQGMHHVDNRITGSIEFVPFIMKSKEAGGYDTKQVSPVKPDSISWNAS